MPDPRLRPRCLSDESMLAERKANRGEVMPEADALDGPGLDESTALYWKVHIAAIPCRAEKRGLRVREFQSARPEPITALSS